MEVKSDKFEHYRKLLSDVDELTGEISSRFQKEITCSLGCTGCCMQHLTLSPVEADFARSAFDQLPEEKKSRARVRALALLEGSAPVTACPLLEGLECMIYESRPVICRTHGMPITFKDEDDGEIYLDVCPLNFSDEGALEEISLSDAVDIDRSNLRLSAINYVYCRDEKGDASKSGERVPMAEMISAILSSPNS